MSSFKPGQLVSPAYDRMRVYSLATNNYALWRESDIGLYLHPCEDCYTLSGHEDLAEVLVCETVIVVREIDLHHREKSVDV